MNAECGGCVKTGGRPFGGECLVAECCKAKGGCIDCADCGLKARLIDEFNALKIPGMPKATELYSLRGAFINLEYTLPGGQKAKFRDDDKIYLGTQLCAGDKCYGLTADENYLLVCAYGEGGSNPEIILYGKRNKL